MKDQLEQPETPTAENSAPGHTSSVPSEPNVTAMNGESATEAPGEQTRLEVAPSTAGSQRRQVRGVHGTVRRPAKPLAKTRGGRPGRPGQPPRPAQPSHSARPAHPAGHEHHYDTLVDEGENEGILGRHRTKIVIAAIVLLGGGALYFLNAGKSTSGPKAAPQMVRISMPPPLPPPPPPPPPKVVPPPPQQEQKMVQETAAEEKPKEEAPKPQAPEPAPLGTGIKGDGPGMSGLGGSGNGGGFGGGKGGGGGSKWGWYAGQVQARVAEALRRNSHTKTASMKIQVRIWSDTTGRVTRAKLDGTTGDPKLDAAIQNEVLTNLQLSEPPPSGMPMPIVMRLTARRP